MQLGVALRVFAVLEEAHAAAEHEAAVRGALLRSAAHEGQEADRLRVAVRAHLRGEKRIFSQVYQ